VRLANEFDLNSRVSRIKVTAAGFDQFDTLAVAIVIVRFFIYLIAAALIHDYDKKIVIAAAFAEIMVMIFTLIATFKRDILAGCILRLIGEVCLAAAAIGVIYVNGIITTYLTDVQMRESVIVLHVVLNILFVIAEVAVMIFSIDVFLAASTAKHRKSRAADFKARIKPSTQMVGTGLCVALLALPALLAGVIVSGLDNVKIENKTYQIVKSEYVYYDYPATARKRNNGCVLTYGDDSEIVLAETPVYYDMGGAPEKMMMPKAYAIVEPAISSTKRVDTLSTIEAGNEGIYIIRRDDKEREAVNFFLYDGGDSYVFFNDMELTVGDKKVNITPFTYLKATYNGSLTVFNPTDSSINTYSLIGRDAVVNLKDGTQLDIVTDILIKTDGSEQMLFVQPQNLDEYVG